MGVLGRQGGQGGQVGAGGAAGQAAQGGPFESDAPLTVPRIEFVQAQVGPKAPLVVRWTVSKQLASGRDWVGLYRHDTPDESWMTTRQVTLSRQGAASGPGHGTVTGEIKFHAPPSIGKYDVRYFQGHNSQRLRQKNKSRGGGSRQERGRAPRTICACQNTFDVEVQGDDVEEYVGFLKEKMDPSSDAHADSIDAVELAGWAHQLQRIFMQVRCPFPASELIVSAFWLCVRLADRKLQQVRRVVLACSSRLLKQTRGTGVVDEASVILVVCCVGLYPFGICRRLASRVCP